MADLSKQLAAFAAQRTPVKGPCIVCDMGPDRRATLRAGRAQRYSYGLLADFFTSQGYKVSEESVRKHFRRGHEQG